MIDYNTRLIQVPRPLDASLVRKAMLANCYSIIGVGASNKKTRPLFENILGPVNGKWDLDRPFRAIQINGKWVTQGVSTCALVCRGLWKRMNVDMDAIYKDYIFGTAISAEITFARKNKAWQPNWKDKALDLRPEFGDYVVIGSGLSTHVLTVIGWGGDNGDTLISVDGGQVDAKNLQCIKRVERPWIQKGVTDDKLEPYLGTRKVLGWIVFDMLPFKGETMIVPEGWDDI